MQPSKQPPEQPSNRRFGRLVYTIYVGATWRGGSQPAPDDGSLGNVMGKEPQTAQRVSPRQKLCVLSELCGENRG